jgi:zinc-finger of a C2HC-type
MYRKADSEAFRKSMQAARGDPSLAVAEPVIDKSLIQCPHCSRRFSKNAAERHLPVCQNIRAKPTSLKKGTGGLINNRVSTPSSSKYNTR